MSSHAAPASSTRAANPATVVRRIVVILLLALAGALLYQAGAIGFTAWQALTTARSALAQVRGVPTSDWPAARPTMQKLADRLDALDARVQPLAPALHPLEHLPGYAALLGALPELAQAGPQAAEVALALLDLAAATPSSATSTDPVTSPEAAALQERVTTLRATLAAVRQQRLPPPVADALALADAGLQLSPAWLNLLGMDGPRTYLVLVQNNHELRATGGFLSAVGTVTVDQGRLVDLDFADSYDYFQETLEYPWAPEPVQRYMGIDLMLLRDANWSPNLPTTAELVRWLYARETGHTVDGIVTVDLNAVKYLVRALEPLYVADTAAAITADNMEQQLIRLWEQPGGDDGSPVSDAEWWERRKDFVPTMVQAMLARLREGEVRPLELATALHAALADRSVQVWLADGAAQQAMADRGWDGSLRHRPGEDFLAVVDANLGYNKVDAVLRRALAYTVRWPDGPEQPAEATLELTYTHPAQGSDPDCTPTPRYGETYADIIARCYFDYVRVYAPAGSELVAAEGLAPDSVTSRRGEENTQEFAGYFVLPPGGSQRVTWTYRLPAGISPDDYRLSLLRQAGTGPLPVTLDVNGVTHTAELGAGRLEWELPDAP